MLSLFTYSKTVDLGFRNYCGSMKLEITKASTFQCSRIESRYYGHYFTPTTFSTNDTLLKWTHTISY